MQVKSNAEGAARIWRDDLRVVRESAGVGGTDGTEPVPPEGKTKHVLHLQAVNAARPHKNYFSSAHKAYLD